MKKALVAALSAILFAVCWTAPPAQASEDGRVSANEFWNNLWNMTQPAFQNNVCDCNSAYAAQYLNSDHTSKFVTYYAGTGYTRDVRWIGIKMDRIDGYWRIRNFETNGGKQQTYLDSSGDWHTAPYPVGCVGAPC